MSYKIRRNFAGIVVCGASDKLGLHGVTPTTRPSGAAQAAVTGTAAGDYNDGDTVESTLINAQKALANKLRTDLVALGFMRGDDAGAVIGSGRRLVSRRGSGVILASRSDLGVGFHGAAPVAMDEGTAGEQAAIATTAGATWDADGVATVNSIKALLNAMRLSLVNHGIIVGSNTAPTEPMANFRMRKTLAGVRIGGSTNTKIGFFGASPTVQRTAAAQAALTAADADETWGAGEVTLVNACTVLVNELRTALVNKGLIKGSA